VATVAGDWVSINGVPYEVTVVAGAGPFTFTISRGLMSDTASGTIGYVFKGVTVSTDYALAHGEAIVLTPGANQYVPKAGNFIKVNGVMYAVVDVPAANTLLLDRPLEAIITAASHKIQTVPNGSYSFAFHRDCMTAVIRPLAPTRAGAGALSAVASANGLSVRAQMWYSGVKQTMQVSLDFLMGVKVLDTNLGAVMVS
jgi:hypothetical protein